MTTFHEFFDRVFAVADDVPGHAFGRSDKLAVDDQQAMVIAFDVALNDNRAAVFARLLETDLDLFRRTQVDRDTASVIARQRLENDRDSRCVPPRALHRVSPDQ